MPNPFNSKSGFEFDINNIVSKIRLDFDTNVGSPQNYMLGINESQTEFILIDPDSLTNTNVVDTTLDLEILNGIKYGKVANYIFEKLVDPSVVGCSNCDKNTNVRDKFIASGELPILNREVIAEFEVSPSAIHSLEINLIGHRKVCDDSGNCFESPNTNDYRYSPIALNAKPSWPTNNTWQHTFIDYSCCPCCDAKKDYDNGIITLTKRNEICEASNIYITPNVSYPTFLNYCSQFKNPTMLENSNILVSLSHCELIENTKKIYGTEIDPTLLKCSDNFGTESIVSSKLIQVCVKECAGQFNTGCCNSCEHCLWLNKVSKRCNDSAISCGWLSSEDIPQERQNLQNVCVKECSSGIFTDDCCNSCEHCLWLNRVSQRCKDSAGICGWYGREDIPQERQNLQNVCVKECSSGIFTDDCCNSCEHCLWLNRVSQRCKDSAGICGWYGREDIPKEGQA